MKRRQQQQQQQQLQFFKVLVDDFLLRLSLPPAFIHYVLGELPSDAFLKTNSSKEWSVRMSKTDTGDVLFDGEGWSEFAEYHNLQLGEFLVFRYNGCQHFRVRIFSTSGSERENVSEEVTPEEPKEKAALVVDEDCETSKSVSDAALEKERSRLKYQAPIPCVNKSAANKYPNGMEYQCDLRKAKVANSENCSSPVIEISDRDDAIAGGGGNDKYLQRERGLVSSSVSSKSFSFVIGEGQHRGSIYIPSVFYQHNRLRKYCKAKLFYGHNPEGKTFIMSSKQAGGIIYGLTSFYDQNNFKVGDSCRIEHIRGSACKISKICGRSKHKRGT